MFPLLAKLGRLPAKVDVTRRRDPSAASTTTAEVPNDLSFLVGIRQRIPLLGQGPGAVTLVGSRAYVASYFSDTLDVLDLDSPHPRTTPIPLGPSGPVPAVRRGEMLFNDATLSFQGWQSLRSCHSDDGRVDGLNWDLLNDGIGNPKNTRSLVWAHRTPPAMSTGVRETARRPSAPVWHTSCLPSPIRTSPPHRSIPRESLEPLPSQARETAALGRG